MQAIFNFKGNVLVNWETDVLQSFPTAHELSTPWRWHNASADKLGYWLLDAREKLKNHIPLDLRTLPDYVVWYELNSKDDHAIIRKAAQTSIPGKKSRVLIMCDSISPQGQRELASQTPGASTIEAVDLRDLTSFGVVFSTLKSDSLFLLLNFIQQVMKKSDVSVLIKRIESLRTGTARKEPSKTEQYCLRFLVLPTNLWVKSDVVRSLRRE
jgi:DNA helicase-2/ATP-dependent DNA helicase PcrA